jgi:hypothetical protein
MPNIRNCLALTLVHILIALFGLFALSLCLLVYKTEHSTTWARRYVEHLTKSHALISHPQNPRMPLA